LLFELIFYMLYYLESDIRSHHAVQISQICNEGLVSLLIDTPKLAYFSHQNWNEVLQELADEDIFGNSGEEIGRVFDIGILTINKDMFDKIEANTSSTVHTYLFSTTPLLAEKGKQLEKLGIICLKHKPLTPSEIHNHLSNYIQDRKFNITAKIQQKVEALSDDLFEAIDLSQTVSGLENQDEYLKSLEKSIETHLYMLSIRPTSISSDIKPWVATLADHNQQLILSLLLTKLEKQPFPNKNTLLNNLLNLDLSVKSSSRIPAVTQTKLFLWKLVNSQYEI
jgi:hypothetical protein